MNQIKAKLGKRARQAIERNDAINKAAMGLARRKTWPSPIEISNKTGISVSVIERETALLLDARRKWEEVTGLKHPQWRDPAIAEAGVPAAVNIEATKALADRGKRYRERLAQKNHSINELKERVAELEEEVRRLLLEVRPAELGAILEGRAPKRSIGKSKKRGGV